MTDVTFEAQAIKAMAELLNQHVAELKQDDDCRAFLEAAGFPGYLVETYLNTAREMARVLRVEEIELLSRRAFQ